MPAGAAPELIRPQRRETQRDPEPAVLPAPPRPGGVLDPAALLDAMRARRRGRGAPPGVVARRRGSPHGRPADVPDPGPDNLAALEPLLTDPDPEVAAAARKALRHRWRTPAWHAAVARLAGSDDAAIREMADALRG